MNDVNFQKNVATRGVLTRLESSKIVFPGAPTGPGGDPPDPIVGWGEGYPLGFDALALSGDVTGCRNCTAAANAFLKQN